MSPYIDNFDPNCTPNTTDAIGRRYCFGRQPQVARWNLAQLGQSLIGLFLDPEHIANGIERFDAIYAQEITTLYAGKFGFAIWHNDDVPLISEIYAFLQHAEIDMTIFFRNLAQLDIHAPNPETVHEAFYSEEYVSTEKQCQGIY